MAVTLLCIFRFVRLVLSGQQAVALENAALRMQIAAYRREKSRPNLTDLDRWFWIALRQVWSNWRRALLYVQPDTVVRWQRERFRNFWARLSKPSGRKRGRPTIPSEVRQLVSRMATANPLWGAPRIHAELQLIGISLSERTVSRLLRRLPRPPSQNWKTFLHNHIGQMVSIDFFTVPTATLKVLFVFLVLEHRRREVLHFNVTANPTSEWPAQQIVEAFAYRTPCRYLIRDRDGVYGDAVRLRIRSLGVKEVLTAPQSPWQNAYAERLIGSIRRECLNHFVILNAKHLKRTLARYFDYYHQSRPHLALDKQSPFPREVQSAGRIIAIPKLGGLHHRYERVAA
jgi:transposase InsO family protein